MKTTQKDFKEFIKWVEYYIEKFQLDEWDIYFKFKNIDSVASVTIKHLGRTALFTLDKDTDSELIFDIKETARHEVCHLIISELDVCTANYITEDEHKLANEKLTVKLTRLLEDK